MENGSKPITSPKTPKPSGDKNQAKKTDQASKNKAKKTLIQKPKVKKKARLSKIRRKRARAQPEDDGNSAHADTALDAAAVTPKKKLKSYVIIWWSYMWLVYEAHMCDSYARLICVTHM